MFQNLFNKEIVVINAGLESFYEDLISQSVRALQMNWQIPNHDEKMLELLKDIDILD